MGKLLTSSVALIILHAYTVSGHKAGSKNGPPNAPLRGSAAPAQPQNALSTQESTNAAISPQPAEVSPSTSPFPFQNQSSPAAPGSAPSRPPEQFTMQLGVAGSIGVPDCNFPSTFPPLAQWQRWSNPATWGPAGPPGPGDTATIYCGQYVLFDLPLGPGGGPSVVLRLLNVTGVLMFEDSAAVGDLHLAAEYIVIHGMLLIGSPTNHFRCAYPLCVVGARLSWKSCVVYCEA